MNTTIPLIKEKLCSEIGYQYEHVIVSLLHKVKTKEKPQSLILKLLSKNNISISTELKHYIHSLDFENIKKSKHGGRGHTRTLTGYRE